MTLKILFSVDDVAPVPGYGLLLNNDPLKYLKKLHDEFGCKFTLFGIPMMNGDENNRWDKNLNWAKKLKNEGFYEIAQHGLTHQAKNPELRAQELANLSPDEIKERLKVGRAILKVAGFDVKGFKPPGWFITPETYDILNNDGYMYIADHIFGNQPLKYKNLYKVPYTFSIDKIYHTQHKDCIIFHSHISRNDGNMNGWNEELYQNVRNALLELKEKNELEFVTMSEWLSR